MTPSMQWANGSFLFRFTCFNCCTSRSARNYFLLKSYQPTREIWDDANGQNEKSDDKHAGDPF